MREIKAYIRASREPDVVHALRDAGIRHLALNHVRSLGVPAIDPQEAELSLEAEAQVMDVVKLELVCAEADVQRLVTVIRRCAHTGEPGDGLIFVLPVDRAVKIRTGEEGRAAVR